ncbi:lethal(2) giant larvae protein homolog 1 isoform X1 [Arapaima gigas]
MMKFRFRRQGNDPQREKIKQDLFAFNKTVEHGFPNQPSALAYDPKLRLMAIGTKSGAVKIYGAPGVEFTSHHKDTATVTQMHFLPGQGRLLTLLDDNTLHLWEISQREGSSSLEDVANFTLPGRPGFESTSATRVTVILLRQSCDLLYLGTEGGGVHFLKLPSLTLLDAQPLFQDHIMQSVPSHSGKAADLAISISFGIFLWSPFPHRFVEVPGMTAHSPAQSAMGIFEQSMVLIGGVSTWCKQPFLPFFSGVLEEIQAGLSSTVLDSPNSSADITLDTTGDITVEDVKDFLMSVDEAERNLKNISEEDGRSPGILIK